MIVFICPNNLNHNEFVQVHQEIVDNKVDRFGQYLEQITCLDSDAPSPDEAFCLQCASLPKARALEFNSMEEYEKWLPTTQTLFGIDKSWLAAQREEEDGSGEAL